jgi:hypothetical protein
MLESAAVTTPAAPPPVRVDLGRASAVAILLTVVIFGALTAAGVYAAVDATETAVTVIGYTIAGLCGLVLLLLLVALPKLLRRRGLEFDDRGLHYWQGDERMLLPWAEIAAVGVGYEQPPEVPSLPLSVQDAIKDAVADKIKDAVKLDDKRRVALEIFPADPAAADRQPLLTPFRKEQAPPAPGLPPVRWRLVLPPVLGVARAAERGVRTSAPQRWLGWFARPWTGGLRL